jgi:hypothetical protein
MEPQTPQASGGTDRNKEEKGSEEMMKPQTLQSSGGAAHNDGEKGLEQSPAHDQEPTQFPEGVPLALIIFSIWLALFLCTLVSLTVVLLLKPILLL